MPMSNELSWHLEECYLLGFGETSFAVDGVHYYFNLKAMYQENPKTGTKRRIRRNMV
jgi:hypothetical protein